MTALSDTARQQHNDPVLGATAKTWTEDSASGKSGNVSAFVVMSEFAAFENFILSKLPTTELAEIIIAWGNFEGSHVIPESACFSLHLKTYLESIMGKEGTLLSGQGDEVIICRGLGYGSAKLARRAIHGFCEKSGTPNPFVEDPIFVERMGLWKSSTADKVRRTGIYDLLDYLPKAYKAIQSTGWEPLKKEQAWAMRLVGVYIGARAGSQLAEYCPYVEDILIPPKESTLYYGDGLPHYIVMGVRRWKGRPTHLQGEVCWLKVIRNPNPKYQRYCVMRIILFWLTISGIKRGPLFRRLVGKGASRRVAKEDHKEEFLLRKGKTRQYLDMWVSATAGDDSDEEEEDDAGDDDSDDDSGVDSATENDGEEEGSSSSSSSSGGEEEEEEEEEHFRKQKKRKTKTKILGKREKPKGGGGGGRNKKKVKAKSLGKQAKPGGGGGSSKQDKPKQVNMTAGMITRMTNTINELAGFKGEISTSKGKAKIRAHSDRAVFMEWVVEMGGSIKMAIDVTMHKIVSTSWVQYFGDGWQSGNDYITFDGKTHTEALAEMFPFPHNGIRITISDGERPKWMSLVSALGS
eukprot:CAMPEP_0171990690 /NCGR_PEP_ID=MMETSP0993-20121228/277047_1 /TAXON_ID=483369 /ORGANISM="non described non described, Strain CCMP2098" /LENGTH=576 /DNA_ID=CAMNT_0012643703 /DNA_START=249 /DNA_END=1979 /DNA_ORIENTATION=+